MKTKFMTAVALVALATAAGAVSAEAKTKKVKHVKAHHADVAGPAVKGPAVEGPSRFNNLLAILGGGISNDAVVGFLSDPRDISYMGLTVFGAVDLGAGWQSHGSQIDGGYPYGVPYGIQKFSNHPHLGAAPGGLGYSNVGIKGSWDTGFYGFKVVADAETNFDVATASLLDGPNSLYRMAGKTAAYQGANGDSSRGGQAFNNQYWGGFKHDVLGQLTYGRHTTFITDELSAFDPLKGAPAFSLLGFSGSLAGGTTEAGRLDNSLKYKVAYGPIYGGAIVKLADSQGVMAGKGESYGFNLGGTYAGFTLDGTYHYTKDAISLGGLSSITGIYTTAYNNGWRTVATLSNNEEISVAGKYVWNQFTFAGGYEHIRMTNASDMPTAGYSAANLVSYYDPNDYRYIVTNTNPFPNQKILEVFWGGAAWAYNDKLTLSGSYYHLEQNSFATAARKCSNASNSNCSGQEDAFGVMAQYAFNKRFQVYGGVQYTVVTNGLANGYLYTVNWAPSVGARWTF
ncbi:hypothetical protein CCR94_23315 [Rhodoblastus sphagnicola]|uniref:Uncharacterized protein n=1 Tax=Rhodoblastus sphagnicola TaxID=333368 RepID=A0A2S6MUC4_9HYPH|nr:porin [Rhodoblastus sphagnicola]MBB4197034.1 putative porin [Rhodoblastus sphagnicola]PPQ25965.1 hypothetical protein CCR94_23315 [Rhodoblastus sphagnicola]